jgi:lysophospholipase L1-like esterase
MALSKPCEVMIWTSSHGTDYHHFPSNLEKAFNENTHPRKTSLIQLPLVNAIPGRQTTKTFVSDVRKEIETIPWETRRVNIIMMGCNDIRSNDYIGACRIETSISQLIGLHKSLGHGLIVCGLLPSPVSWTQQASLFHRVSSRLYKQTEMANSGAASRQIAFLRLNHIFLDEKGFIDEEKFFERDRIHLNPTGAYQLAKHLIDSMIPIIETFV